MWLFRRSTTKILWENKEQSKKCLLLSTNNISSALTPILEKIPAKEGVAEEKYIAQTLEKLNIDYKPIKPQSFFERETINIEKLLGAPGPGDGIINELKDYGIIIIAGHGGLGGSLSIENYMDLFYQKGEDDWWEHNWMPDSISQIDEHNTFKDNLKKYEIKYGKNNITSAFITFEALQRDLDTGYIWGQVLYFDIIFIS